MADPGCTTWHADVSMTPPGGVGLLTSAVGPVDVSIDQVNALTVYQVNGLVGSMGPRRKCRKDIQNLLEPVSRVSFNQGLE